MDPRNFLSLARKLSGGNSPAEIRTAISRCYYSVFNVSVGFLKGMGFRVSEGPSGHGDVQRCLSNSTQKNIQRVGSQLADLHSRRVQADYRLDRKEIENQKNAQALVIQAQKMIQTLDDSLTGPTRERIIDSIRRYLEKLRPRP
jgi:uncharacterized protein (UPF0332 family)